MSLTYSPTATDHRARRCVDVICDRCGSRFVTDTGSPTLAACHAEVAGWTGQGRRGMFCPSCTKGTK